RSKRLGKHHQARWLPGREAHPGDCGRCGRHRLGGQELQAYARECVLNAYRDHLRASGTRTGIGEIVLPPDEENRIYRIDDRAEETVSSLDLRRALLQLGEENRSLIYLRYYEGYGIAEAVQDA